MWTKLCVGCWDFSAEFDITVNFSSLLLYFIMLLLQLRFVEKPFKDNCTVPSQNHASEWEEKQTADEH